jgi:hypothetical protein
MVMDKSAERGFLYVVSKHNAEMSEVKSKPGTRLSKRAEIERSRLEGPHDLGMRIAGYPEGHREPKA